MFTHAKIMKNAATPTASETFKALPLLFSLGVGSLAAAASAVGSLAGSLDGYLVVGGDTGFWGFGIRR
ncbi:hypothetical protein FRX31_013880 [Thalictrum thalictroides]|uniref:Uncharacterized protein n=1 Tax=Thalictrum thalictroides TaxID=46969 RepID=A0A7J6WHV7_THATH|nr:hypothetical protein FRX31_013880 [Thalictrum thalictroides]